MNADDPISFRPSLQVLFQQMGDDTVLLNLDTERYYGLDEIGTRFWQLLSGHQTMTAIVAAMVAEFDVDEATLRADLAQLVSELVAARILIPKDRDAPA